MEPEASAQTRNTRQKRSCFTAPCTPIYVYQVTDHGVLEWHLPGITLLMPFTVRFIVGLGECPDS